MLIICYIAALMLELHLFFARVSFVFNLNVCLTPYVSKLFVG